MNYLNQIQNPIINLTNIGQIITGGKNFHKLPGQINNIGMNPLNNVINNNNQYPIQFNPNIIPQKPQTTTQQ